MSKKPIIPMLDSSSNNLSQPTDIIEYILRHYTNTPKNISDTHRAGEISAEFDGAKHAHDPNAMAAAVESSLRMVYSKYFPEADNLTVSVEQSPVDEQEYNLSIDIVVTIDGVPHSLGRNVKVDRDGIMQFEIRGIS